MKRRWWVTTYGMIVCTALGALGAWQDEIAVDVQEDEALAWAQITPSGTEVIIPDVAAWDSENVRAMLEGIAPGAVSRGGRPALLCSSDMKIDAGAAFDVPGGRATLIDSATTELLLSLISPGELDAVFDGALVVYEPSFVADPSDRPRDADHDNDAVEDPAAAPADPLALEAPSVSGEEVALLDSPMDANLWPLLIAPDVLDGVDLRSLRLATLRGSSVAAGAWQDVAGGRVVLIDEAALDAVRSVIPIDIPADQPVVAFAASDVADEAGDSLAAAPESSVGATPSNDDAAPQPNDDSSEIILLDTAQIDPQIRDLVAQLVGSEQGRVGVGRGPVQLDAGTWTDVAGGRAMALDVDTDEALRALFDASGVALAASDRLVVFVPQEAAAEAAQAPPVVESDAVAAADDALVSAAIVDEATGDEVTFLPVAPRSSDELLLMVNDVPPPAGDMRNARLAAYRGVDTLPHGQWRAVGDGYVCRIVDEAVDVVSAMIEDDEFVAPAGGAYAVFVSEHEQPVVADDQAGRQSAFPSLDDQSDPLTDPQFDVLPAEQRAAMANLQGLYPEVRYYLNGTRVTRAYGAPFGGGATPQEAAETFVAAHAGVFGSTPVDLRPGNQFNDELTQDLMFDEATGKHTFTLVYFTQHRDGIPVIGAELRVMVRNEPDYPIVWVGSSLRDLSGFELPRAAIGNDPGTIGHEQAQAIIPDLAQFSPSLQRIWAGIDHMQVAPQLVVMFDATNSPDTSMGGRVWRFMANPQSGEIVHYKDQMCAANVSGNVKIRHTDGFKADSCASEVSDNMKSAKVFNFLPPVTVYASTSGNYSMSVNTLFDVVVETKIEGRHFIVEDKQGSLEHLTKSVPNGGTGNFVHNEDNSSGRIRAQANGYFFADFARRFLLDSSNGVPSFPTIKSQNDFPVHVNHDENPLTICPCNAWYFPGLLGIGATINFCRAEDGCPNTAFGGVIFHEYGHHVVAMAGSGQGQYGEGFGDCMNILAANDRGVGYGLNRDDDCSKPIRRSGGSSFQFPCNGGDPHDCAPLISGCVWDTYQELGGDSTDLSVVKKLTLNSVLLHTGELIEPDITIDFVTLDDTNGKLWDGTPHGTAIAAAFGEHNMGVACSDRPTTPANVIATNASFCDKVRVTWSASTRAQRYRITRAPTFDVTQQKEIGNTTGTTFEDNDWTLDPNLSYYYWVTAENFCGRSGTSNADVGTISDPPPAPSGMNASDGTQCNAVRIVWNAVSGATGYTIWRSTVNSPETAVQIGTDTASPYDDTTASSSGTHYYYWVRTTKACGKGGFGLADSGFRGSVPDAPGIIVASDNNCSAIVVNWTDVAGATSYMLYRNTTNNSATATLLATVTSSDYSWTSATPATTYFFWAKAKNTCGTSGFSNATTGTRLPGPGVPTGVSASDETSCTSVEVTWNAAAEATGYTIWRNTVNNSATATQIGSDPVSPFNDTTATPGTTYYYWVKGTSACGSSAFSTSNSGKRKAAPKAPASVTASDGTSCEHVAIAWPSATGATAYSVWRGTTSNSAQAALLGVTNVLKFTDTTATPNVTYHYWVRSRNDCGDGAFGTPNTGFRTAPLPAPGVINATDNVHCAFVRVSWNHVSGATGYTIWRHTSNDESQATQIASDTASPYDDTSATPGQVYFYWVRASAACGKGLFSDPDSGSRPGVIAAPTGVGATDGTSCTFVTVSWNAVSGASSYTIWRNTTNNSATAKNIGSDSASPFSDSTATAGTTYFYWVKAVDACGSSGFSSVASGFREKTPSAPTGVSASDATSCDSVSVSWTAVSNADGYTIFRGTSSSSASATQIGSDSASPFNDVTATPGTTYYYWVKASNQCGTSGFSASNTGSRKKAPATPTGVAASDGLSGFVRVSWSTVSGASSYRIYRSLTNNSADAELIANDSASPFNDTTAIPFLTYHYWVRATNDCGTSGFSSSNSGWRLP